MICEILDFKKLEFMFILMRCGEIDRNYEQMSDFIERGGERLGKGFLFMVGWRFLIGRVGRIVLDLNFVSWKLQGI